MTNFRKIASSPRALAKFLVSLAKHHSHTNDCLFYESVRQCERFSSCENCITKWLKQEAEKKE